MIDKTAALTLKHGQILHHVTAKQNNGKECLRVRVTGKVKTWKTQPDDFCIPVKHGLRDSGYITQENGQYWVIPV